MNKTKELLGWKEPEDRETAGAEGGSDLYEVLALDIIREVAKLRRPLDVYDAPSLARLIKEAAERFVTDSVTKQIHPPRAEGRGNNTP